MEFGTKSFDGLILWEGWFSLKGRCVLTYSEKRSAKILI
jgi:hypothetical protein